MNFYSSESKKIKFFIMQKVLFVAPHLSTGGCPQYLLKKIEKYRNELEIYVVEYNFLGDAYVVQRNAIIKMIPTENFFTLGERKEDLLQIIDRISPDIIHFEELSESMCSYEMLEHIYLKHQRSYYITETTHSSESNPEHKVFLPDKFIFASKYSLEKFKKLGVPSTVWEYPIEKKERPNRNEALRKLNLDSKKIHILNVGLFTPGKNQKELIEIAQSFANRSDVVFHFVGNQAPNFEHYWKPLMENLPVNCKVWGERGDVEEFMKACDIFYFSSTFELNPLVIKEALSWNMPIMMYNLHTYMQSYDDTPEITFLSEIEANIKSLHCLIQEQKNAIVENTEFKAKLVHIVSDLESEIEKTSIASVSRLASKNLEYTIHLNPVTTEFNKKHTAMFENPNLKPGHFGCFEAFRKAIVEDFTEDYDFLIVCERDCIIEKSPDEIHSLLKRTFICMENESIDYFSFGDKVDLDNGFTQSENLRSLEDFAFVTNKIIGLQFIIFSKSGVQFLREKFKTYAWYGMDIWLNIVYEESGKLMGILNERATTQLDGYSLIDETHKTFKMNQR
jgi:glycosyltransferase involved in cell wall biosynthesis